MPTQPLSLRILTIADPCSVPWSEMKGAARTRFCGHCRKNVYNISELTDAEASDLLARNEPLCVRLHRRRDGTVATRDCSRRRRWLDRATMIAASVFAALLAGLGCSAPPKSVILGGVGADRTTRPAVEPHPATHVNPLDYP